MIRSAQIGHLAEVSDFPGVMVYGQTRDEVVAKVEALALRAIADSLKK